MRLLVEMLLVENVETKHYCIALDYDTYPHRPLIQTKISDTSFRRIRKELCANALFKKLFVSDEFQGSCLT